MGWKRRLPRVSRRRTNRPSLVEQWFGHRADPASDVATPWLAPCCSSYSPQEQAGRGEQFAGHVESDLSSAPVRSRQGAVANLNAPPQRHQHGDHDAVHADTGPHDREPDVELPVAMGTATKAPPARHRKELYGEPEADTGVVTLCWGAAAGFS